MNNLIEKLMALAMTSNIKQKHASAIFNNLNTPIYFGVNNSILSSSGFCTIHSEQACMSKLLKSYFGSYVLQKTTKKIKDISN